MTESLQIQLTADLPPEYRKLPFINEVIKLGHESGATEDEILAISRKVLFWIDATPDLPFDRNHPFIWLMACDKAFGQLKHLQNSPWAKQVYLQPDLTYSIYPRHMKWSQPKTADANEGRDKVH